jgi:uncharacterized membrane protein
VIKTSFTVDPHLVTIIGIIMVGAIEIAAICTDHDGTTMIPVVGAICLLAGYKLPDLLSLFKKP